MFALFDFAHSFAAIFVLRSRCRRRNSIYMWARLLMQKSDAFQCTSLHSLRNSLISFCNPGSECICTLFFERTDCWPALTVAFKTFESWGSFKMEDPGIPEKYTTAEYGFVGVEYILVHPSSGFYFASYFIWYWYFCLYTLCLTRNLLYYLSQDINTANKRWKNKMKKDLLPSGCWDYLGKQTLFHP